MWPGGRERTPQNARRQGMLGAYLVAGLAPLVACALLLVASVLVATDRYPPARRALGPLLFVAGLSLFAGIGSLLAVAMT